MSIGWASITLNDTALQRLPRHQMPSPALKRACVRYLAALEHVNALTNKYNNDVLLHAIARCRTHDELTRLIKQDCLCLPFATAPLPSVAEHTQQLLTLHDASKSVERLKDTLDEWREEVQVWGVEPPGGENGEAEAVNTSFSIFARPVLRPA
jgi:hypothetical protein